jgi:pimeloyl-ACP methyl ester carboxylesterase
MPSFPLPTLRYLRAWVRDRSDLETGELVLSREGRSVPATLVRPARLEEPAPAWILLHGITRPGRAHRQLVRFTRALAATGCEVLVPEVPEWRDLRLAPMLTVPTVDAALRSLEGRAASIGLLGFSFGAPQAIAASGHERIRGRLAGVAGFGGYCDLERTLVFQFTGRHEDAHGHHRLRPDPYGRWIVGANYLTEIPGLSDAAAVAEGLRRMAAMAGDQSVVAWDPALDPLRAKIRKGLGPRDRELFDLFAPPSPDDPEPAAAEEIAHALAAAARRVEPGIEPAPLLRAASGPVHILHGRQDHLIPFSEAQRLYDALPGGIRRRVTVTRIFGHSARDPLPPLQTLPGEGLRFLGALSGLLSIVRGS